MTDTNHIDSHCPAAEEQPSLPLDLGPAIEPASPAPSEPFAGLTLSKSEIGVLRRCPRRYQYEYVLGRAPAAGPGIEAQWGTALHRGLEVWYAPFEGDELSASRGEHLKAAIDHALEEGVEQDGRPYAPPADPYARAALRAMLRAYAAAWGPGDAERYEVVAVELPFDLPVLTAEGRVSRGRREGARREGRIDAMVRERGHACPGCEGTGRTTDQAMNNVYECGQCQGSGRIGDRSTWIVEHKSTGKPPAEDRFYLGIDLDLQSALYYDAARELGYQPAGVLYDVIRRPDFDDPKPPPSLKLNGEARKQKADVAYTNPRHGEPAAVYEERVYQLAIERPGDFFHRRALTIEPWQIEEAREDVRAAALEIAWRTREELWPRVGDRYVCAAPRMTCPWIDVCGRRSSAEDDRLFPLKRKKEGTT